MPIYESKHVEYATVSGHVDVMMEDGRPLPAYWARPNLGGTFSGVVFVHDWWGIRPLERRLSQLLAQMGYYVLVPDLFDTRVAKTAQQAMEFVQELGSRAYAGVDAALQVMETHSRSNRRVAVVGLGMGGSLAYEAAIKRSDLEAAVSFYGFPQRYMGHFAQAKTPILAIYGSAEPYSKPPVLKRLSEELASAPVGHELHILPGAGRDFFAQEDATATQAWALLEAFLEEHLSLPKINRFAPR
jgi:carboxymethylenebutenolidase